MKALMLAATLAAGLIGSTRAGMPDAPQAPSTGVYHASSEHLWNRLHDALFVRAGSDGRQYGRDRVEPLLWRGSRHLLHGESHARLLAVLDEFLDRRGERLLDEPIRRAMLQRDLWLVFSWLEHGHDEFHAAFGGAPAEWRVRQEELRRPLARAIGRLALSPRQIAELPDTYAAALASGEFATRFDPQQPDRPYLPADLFAEDGPWVSLGRDRDLIARSHVLNDNPFTNSAFLVFIKLPGTRVVTLDYVKQLREFSGPLFVKAGSSPTPVFPDFNPAIPQFPEGTEVALVRRALLVASTAGLIATPLTEGVQVRVYREIPALSPRAAQNMLGADEHRRTVAAWQASYEFVLSRARLITGRSGGLRPIGADDRDFHTGFNTQGNDPFETVHGESPAESALRSETSLRAAAVPQRHMINPIAFCRACHGLPGVYSFNTLVNNFGRGPGQQLTPLYTTPVSQVLSAAVKWKESRADWLLLRQLMFE